MDITPASLLKSHPRTKEILRKSARIETAAIFGAMLLDERLQSNCVRLEALTHLALAIGEGHRLPTQATLAECFNDLGSGICGRMEDPAEDLLVSLVTTAEGNFRVLEGIWESGTFFLQRVLGIVESFPDDGELELLRRQVFALLRISEAVCDRANLPRYSIGASTPTSKVTATFCSKAKKKLLYFNADEIARLGITLHELKLFTFTHQHLSQVLTTSINHSPLQRFPIVNTGDGVALLLPTAVSSAIRVAVVSFLLARGYRGSLQRNLCNEYSRLVHGSHLLGSFPRASIHFSNADSLAIAEVIAIADVGCYFHFLFFTDALDDFHNDGLAGIDNGPSKYSELLHGRIRHAMQQTRNQRDFRSGITLLIHCGIGRTVFVPLPEEEHADWEVQFLPAPALITLSHSHRRINALSIRRILNEVKVIEALGVRIHNLFGLLNLIAWIDADEGHLVAQSFLPREFRRTPGQLFLAAHFVLELRHSVAIADDVHALPTVDGRFEVVRRFHDSFFSEDNEHNIYTVDYFSPDCGIPFAHTTGGRTWWCHVVPTEKHTGDYDRWSMLKTWFPRIAQAMTPHLDASLGHVVLVRVVFSNITSDCVTTRLPDREEIERACSVTVDAKETTVTVNAGPPFDLGLALPTNTAERALVMVICKALARLSHVPLTPSQLEEIECQIVQSDDARQLHVFHAKKYRDFVHADLAGKVIEIDHRDVADLSYGLAFRVESREKGRSRLRSKRQCTGLLNAVVRSLEDELCSDLQRFNRLEFVEMALRNHERAMLDRETWNRTARANLALHRDKPTAANVIANHDLELNSVLFPSRVLIEFALCECPLSLGIRPGQLDLSRLMAKVNAILQLGGWSNAIHLDAMPPKLNITPLGDIRAESDFQSSVLAPFSRRTSHGRISVAVDEYAENFEQPKTYETHTLKIEQDFESSWLEEFGFSVDDVRRFMDAIDDLGLADSTAVYRVSTSELLSRLEVLELEQSRVQNILAAFVLFPRETWRTIPDGFHDKDTQPWRFRRRLSAIRRPIFQIDHSADPLLMIAPGFVREALAYVINGFYEGSFPDEHYRTKAMRNWRGKRANKRGTDFAALVAKRVQELGWTTAKNEIEVKEILGCSYDEDFGDISRFGDVDVLAWSQQTHRVLVIECKHLHFHKTSGEVAEQLSDYRGGIRRDGKPDDLCKHLNRLELLNARREILCKTLGVDESVQIEGWVVFRNPVPMLYTWKDIEPKTRIATFDDIDSLLQGFDCSVT